MPRIAPIESATPSINSILRPRKESNPCISSIAAPKAVAITNMPINDAAVSMGREQSHKKVNAPNNTRCVHLSIIGMFTAGISLAGVKQAIRISKVHSIAKNLACFL